MISGREGAYEVRLEDLIESITRAETRGDWIELELHRRFLLRLNKRFFLSKLRRFLGISEDPIVDDGRLVLSEEVDDSLIRDFLVGEIDYMSREYLRNLYTGRRVVMVPDDLPLLGHNAIGLIDRGTNLMQVRPFAGCNLNCIYCSVDEGRGSRTRANDFILSVEHIVDWFNRLADFKGREKLEAHIDGQGEPMMHPRFVDLVQELSDIKGVDIVSVQTNGTFLDEDVVRELEEAGLSRINLSIDTLDPEKARLLSGTREYDLRRILEIAEFIARETKIDLLLAPVWVPGYNDEDIPKLIEFAKKIGAGKRWPALGIQIYMRHPLGRYPRGAKIVSLGRFREIMLELERKTGVKPLWLLPEHFGIHRRKRVRPPFRIGEIVRGEIVLPGRIRGEAIAKSRDWLIEVIDGENASLGESVRIKILGIHDSIVWGRLAG